MEYYANISAFDDDQAFMDRMKAVWDLRSPQVKSTRNYGDTSVESLWNDSTDGVFKNVEALREQLKSRGARGIVGLQRKFRIMDDDGSKTLNMIEFKKAIRECGLKLTDFQMSQLFSYFDADANGCIHLDEFLLGVRILTGAHTEMLYHFRLYAKRNATD